MNINENSPTSQEKSTKQYKRDIKNGSKTCLNCDEIKDLNHFKIYGPTQTRSFSNLCIKCLNENVKTPKILDVDIRRGWKICNTCNIKKHLTEFELKKDFNVYTTKCKLCIFKYKKNYLN